MSRGLVGWAFAALLATGCVTSSRPESAQRESQPGSFTRHTFYLDGGFFYGPGPIVPDTELPNGRLANIRFDVQRMQGFCEFANNGAKDGMLSDQRTRINQNIDAGRLMIGGGTSPVMLTAVDGGPHHGTEQYYLDDQYRFVWRVDIALDPGFADGIIRLNDFVLDTGVVRIARSLQSQLGQPGGYDQAGSLQAGEFMSGRVGDFDEDNYLDGILVAAPNVPLAADMLPGAPVGNRRGFRTDVPIAPQLSAELMLRGATHLRDAIPTALSEADFKAARILIGDLEERLRVSRSRATAAVSDVPWQRAGKTQAVEALLGQLAELHSAASALARMMSEPDRAQTVAQDASRLFDRLDTAIKDIASLNAASGATLPLPTRALASSPP